MRLTFENAALGTLNIVVEEDRVKEYAEALILLGYQPEITME